ncbi:MAG: DEAD/DEAH box helicase, partial [Candidatus Obscuribacterales bacterium]|nr:DEAD/DEAH box helicase [Steroidobacteraceae bacterium]
MSESHLTDLSFTSLHLPESLQKGLADAGFERCTPIQAQTLPQALAGFDIAGQAQTGTGKTVAFLVALYAKLLKEPAVATRNLNAPRAIIVAPTRELAVQIHNDAEIVGSSCGLTLGLAFGGVDYEKQRRHLEAGVDILIGTPGRIIDFYKQHVIDLRAVQVAVLDEADRMFDLGFISDIRYILRRLPPPEQRINMLFSATLSQRVLELAYEHMNNPTLVRIEPDKMTVDRVRQMMYYPSNDEKPRLLVGLLKQMDPRRSMVFVNTRRAAEDVERILRGNGINAEAISGDVPQRKRLRMLRDFHDGTLAVLIGTDVASRGLHIPDVSHVFNYDLPNDPEDYVHRIGRTARAGAEGDAISFGCEEYVMSLPDIEAYIGRRLPVSPVPFELLPDLIASESRQKQHDRRFEGETPPRPGARSGRSGGGRPQRRGQSNRPPVQSSHRAAPARVAPKPSASSNNTQGSGS